MAKMVVSDQFNPDNLDIENVEIGQEIPEDQLRIEFCTFAKN